MPVESEALAAAPSWVSVIPCVVVFALAAWSRRTIEPLVVGVLVGFALATARSPTAPDDLVSGGLTVLDATTESLLAVLADDVIRWIVLVCGLFGAMISVQTVAGGAHAIGELLSRVIRGPRGVLCGTWLLGITIFVDDYLNALTVGSTMRRLADRFGVSRALLAYVVDSTAAPVCLLIPASTWAYYIAGLLEAEGLAAKGEGLSMYIGLIPTIVYAWAAAAMVLVVAIFRRPMLWPMAREEMLTMSTPGEPATDDRPAGEPSPWVAALTFVLPLAVLIGSTLAFGGGDGSRVLKGVVLGLLSAIALGWLLGRKKPAALCDAALEGFGRMVPALAIVVVSFVLKDVNDQLGLTPFLIETTKPWLTQSLLPAMAFVGLSLVTFTTGSYWGTYAIALPIVVPLAQAVGADVPLTVGAVVSAGAFGSHACFYGDATVLSSVACDVPNMTHALTQLPYAVIAAGVTVLVYLAWGALL